MDGDQRIGGPGGRPAAQQGRQGSPFPGAGPDATQAYPAPFGPGHGPQPRDQYGRDQYGRDQHGRDQHGRDQFGRDHEGQYPQSQNPQAPSPQDQYQPFPQNQYGQDQYSRDQYSRDQYGQDQYGQDQYGQDQYGPPGQGPASFGSGDAGSRGPAGSGGPSRRVVLISLGLAALLAAGVGTIFAVTRSNTTTVATTTPSVSLTTPAATTPSTSTSTPAKTVTKTPSTTATIAGTLPTGYVSDPWSNPGMEFGTLTSVKKQGSGAVITVKRQQFLTGAAATEYYAAHPGEQPLDYKVVDLGKSRTLTVAADALVYGQYLLGDQNQVATTQLTTAQFIAKAKDLQSKSLPLYLWLYQRATTSGSVVYVAEQYTP